MRKKSDVRASSSAPTLSLFSSPPLPSSTNPLLLLLLSPHRSHPFPPDPPHSLPLPSPPPLPLPSGGPWLACGGARRPSGGGGLPSAGSGRGGGQRRRWSKPARGKWRRAAAGARGGRVLLFLSDTTGNIIPSNSTRNNPGILWLQM